VYSDAHCHAHEIPLHELEKYTGVFRVIVAVSDDLQSSMKTVELSRSLKLLYPCVGIHPWTVKPTEDLGPALDAIERLVTREDVRCLGEIGLDEAFTPQTIEAQQRVFDALLDLARDHDLAVNLHAAKAWHAVLRMVRAKGIRRALFHWFTGPPDVLAEVVERGYLISINPTVKVSRKHLDVALKAPLTSIVFESDGPYEYRGMSLKPSLIPSTVEYIASLRGLEQAELLAQVNSNLSRFLGL